MEDVQPVRIIVCSDSLSVLNSLSSGKFNRSELLLEVFIILWRIERMGVVRFCWVPAHTGVEGIEIVGQKSSETTYMMLMVHWVEVRLNVRSEPF